jgi:hypothetical protein
VEINEEKLMRSLIFFIFFVVLIPLNAFASKEGLLILSDFSVSSKGLEDSGSVTITGTQNMQGITSLKISVFNKKITLSDELLKKLTGIYMNGLQISYEHGHEITGGRTVYVMFTKGFTSEVEIMKILTINEKGVATIQDKIN